MTEAFKVPDEYQTFKKFIVENIPNVNDIALDDPLTEL